MSPINKRPGYFQELSVLAGNAAKGAAMACLPFFLGAMFYDPANFVAGLLAATLGWLMSFPALAVFAAWSRWHCRNGLPCYPLYLLAGAVVALIGGFLYGGILFRRMDGEAGRVAVLFAMPIVFFMAGAITAGIHWQWLADCLQDDKRC